MQYAIPSGQWHYQRIHLPDRANSEVGLSPTSRQAVKVYAEKIELCGLRSSLVDRFDNSAKDLVRNFGCLGVTLQYYHS